MNRDIPSIYEYLALRDWKFEIDLEEGNHGDFFWLRCPQLADVELFNIVDLPQEQFRVVVPFWDGSSGAHNYRHERYWRMVGDIAVSDISYELPPRLDGTSNAQLILEHPLEDAEIIASLSDFEEPQTSLHLDDDETESFWRIIQRINPYCYFSYGVHDRDFTFVARGERLCRQLVDDAPWKEIENEAKEGAINRSKVLWENIGPECGPELCIEPNCKRLRIKLAVRCFLHQIEWGRNKGEY